MRHSIKSFVMLITLLTIALAGGCTQTEGPQAPSTETDVEAIKGIDEKWNAAMNAGDVDGVISLYTDDTVQMPPNEPALVGKEAVRRSFQTLMEQNTIQANALTEEVQVVGDRAFIRGTYTQTLTPKAGGEAVKETGKWINFNQRQPDGSWKISREMWNADHPPASSQ